MASSGGQPGNKNATKSREWQDALRKELATFEDKSRQVQRGHALRRIARRVVIAALDGDKDAWQEIGNRLDGKPPQAITGEGGGPLLLEEIKRTIVDPK